MSNSPGRSINYKPRMTDAEAYEKLPPKVRRALQEGLHSWSSYSVYRLVEKEGIREALRLIRQADQDVVTKKAFIPSRGIKGKPGYKPGTPSPVVACRVPILRANW